VVFSRPAREALAGNCGNANGVTEGGNFLMKVAGL
jgi:hypothetical protein